MSTTKQPAQTTPGREARTAVRKNGTTKKRNGDVHGNGRRVLPDSPVTSATMINAVGGTVPVTEWDRLSAESRYEVEHLLEVLKAVKQGDFSARFEYSKYGILSRVGELLNDVIGLN